MSALTPYAVTPEPRTDSKPFRRRFVRKTGFGSCRRKFLQKYFRQSFESRSQDGVPRAFYVTFCTTQKVTIRTPSQGDSRFSKPRISTQNQNFALTKLKLFAASRQCPCRDGTLRVHLAALGGTSLCCYRNNFAAASRRIPCCCRNNFRRPAAAIPAA